MIHNFTIPLFHFSTKLITFGQGYLLTLKQETLKKYIINLLLHKKEINYLIFKGYFTNAHRLFEMLAKNQVGNLNSVYRIQFLISGFAEKWQKNKKIFLEAFYRTLSSAINALRIRQIFSLELPVGSCKGGWRGAVVEVRGNGGERDAGGHRASTKNLCV